MLPKVKRHGMVVARLVRGKKVGKKRKNILYIKICAVTTVDDTVAEWLRRSTRNRLELFRVGSSPASVVFL